MSFNHLDPESKNRLAAAAYRRLERMKMAECFDPLDLDSAPTDGQQEILDGIHSFKHRYIRAGNQTGKTQIGARETAWIFEENHPTWERPSEWGKEPLVLLVIGRVTKQVEEVLWRKIKGFLDLGQVKEVRSGGALQKVIHKENGNTIIFASHHAENEAREKLQAYVAHYVWIDEMPGSVSLIEELHRRVMARNGYFLATFTPKIKNDEIRKFVDGQQEPLAKTYRLKMLDNPLYKGREDEILASLEGLTESYRNCILYGEWLRDSNSVYDFDSDKMVVPRLPEYYSPAWRHVEAVDPALKSKFGFVLLAEDPKTDLWYVVKADYITDIYIPREMVEEVSKRTSGYNIVRRVSDPHEVWYMNTATDMKVRPVYQGVYDKTSRKGELMKNLQTSLGTKLLIASWCTDLIDELNSMQWSETAANKIINSSSYHLVDSLQYGVDILPKPTLEKPPVSRDAHLRQMHEKRLNEKAKEAETPTKKGNRKLYRIQRTKRWG